MSVDDMMLREEIAQEIERGALSFDNKATAEIETAVYEALVWAAKIARGEDNMFKNQINFE